MMLANGSKLGPYEILSPLGAGGMGEVYKARDTRLDRVVAIKVLNSVLVASPELKARFEREARAISQLNHPHICTLHDIGHDGGTDYLVMEYLEGESLADRLRKGALPLDQLVRIGCDIADALDRAHRAGIVHRDLKPGNVMLTKSGAKLLDFGLAKPVGMGAAAGSAPLLSAAVTLNTPSPQGSPLTAAGAVVGTIQYMAPEQIEGREADARTDIFAFGAVLYEMATGQRAFNGKTQISVASAILEKDPEPIRALQPASPAALDLIVRTCLAKDPDARYASAHDIALQLKWIAEGTLAGEAPTVQPSAAGKRNVGWLAAAVLALVVIALGMSLWRNSRVQASAPALAYVPAPTDTRLLAFGFGAGPVAVSPDGAKLAFTAIGHDGVIKLWVRPLDSRQATAVPGTENASAPFWSPDSQALGFFADSKLKTVTLSSGSVEVLCDISQSLVGGTWGRGGTILFSNPVGNPLSRIPSAGGKPAPWAPLNGGDGFQSFPAFLPDGDHFFYVSASRQTPRVELGSLSSGTASVVVENASKPQYARGFLLFLREGKVFAQPFDAAAGHLSGVATPLADASTYSAAGSVLAFQSVSGASRLQWYGTDGEARGTIGQDASYLSPRISPNGKQVLALIEAAGNSGSRGDQWSIPADGGVSTRLTFGAGGAWTVWSPDGKYIAYGRLEKGKPILARKPADGSGAEETLMTFDPALIRGVVAVDWSPDGRYLSFDEFSIPRGHFETWILPLSGDRKPFQAAPSSTAQYDGGFSPDGRWFAYFAFDTGRPEVYVVPFPGPGGKYQISNGGGWLTRWANKNHLFFLTTGNQLMDADLALNPQSVQIKSIRPLLQLPLLDTSAPLFDVSQDGKRVLAVTPADPEANSIGLLLNWEALAKPK